MTDQERKDAIRFFEWVAEDEAMNYSRLAIEALKAQEPENVPDTNVGDMISRQAAIDVVSFGITYAKAFNKCTGEIKELFKEGNKALNEAIERLKELPSVQPESLSDAYMKAVWTWLLDYQIKAAELKGRYTPYEVLSWVANDWRKEHDGSD